MLMLRRMEFNDVPIVYKIEKSLFSDPWSEECFLKDISNPVTSYPYVLEVKGRIIGYAICWSYADEIHISNIAIKASYQGNGYGKFILKKIFEIFSNFRFAYLEVREKNIKAINLYEQFGFKKLYCREKYYSDGENALVMIKSYKNL